MWILLLRFKASVTLSGFNYWLICYLLSQLICGQSNVRKDLFQVKAYIFKCPVLVHTTILVDWGLLIKRLKLFIYYQNCYHVFFHHLI